MKRKNIIIEKLEDFYKDYIINKMLFDKVFSMLNINKKKKLEKKIAILLKKIKKLKKISRSIENTINNNTIREIERRLYNSEFSEKEYLDHIYQIYNENYSDIHKWKNMEKEIRLKKREEKTKDDIDSLLILNKSIKLAESVNNDLVQIFIELTKDKSFTKEIQSNFKQNLKQQTTEKNMQIAFGF